MCDRACHFDAQETRNAKQESEKPRGQATPDEYKSIPFNIVDLAEHQGYFVVKYDEWQKEYGRANIRPPCQLYCRIVAVRQGLFDEHGVNSNEHG